MIKKRRIQKIIGAIGIILVAVIIGMLTYLGDYYHADKIAFDALISDAQVTVEEKGNLIIFTPTQGQKDIGFVFYPGGKVEASAYAPLMHLLAEKGLTTVIVKMPFNLAVFNINGADAAMEALPEVSNWIIGGHSLGGAMASDYAAENEEKVSGLVLLGAYPNKDLSQTKITVLSLYGSEDHILNRTAFETAKIKMPADITFYEIIGGNHGNFGNYGEQKGDGVSTISAADQQSITCERIVEKEMAEIRK
ncbi:alpha/beta fold hydrolase [Acetobacterium tundrae]|uniref:Alpha/beta fold hydrolase n=1 Tax=Acetobacterium tundrae TaxID=132932 RepID=A0ABR6WK81_9FIRM|nr:alpha/beta fold hydrolase [Acetobacterium tundrae]MBC3796676.1 alpha/beta fold hydrolase [Acetobacterium tundrae]